MAGIEGHDNSNSGVLEAIQEMASAIRQNGNSQQEDVRGKVMRIQGEFRKCQPPIFKGVHDPMAAEEWIRQIKRKLINQRVPDELKVEIACTYLEEQAYHWWESVLSTPDTEITTWDVFENIFLEKYFPSTVKGMKAREFVNLVQDELYVAGYQAKFEELMRFAPNMILDECTKAKRFEDGLKSTIREKVTILKLNRYADMVERALIAEQCILESMATLDLKNLSPPTSESGREGQNGRHFKPGLPSVRQTKMLERTAQDPRVCFHCGKLGHIQKNCPLLQPRVHHAQTCDPRPQFYAPYPPPQNYQRAQSDHRRRHQGGVPIQARPTGPTTGRRLAEGRAYCLGQLGGQVNPERVEGKLFR